MGRSISAQTLEFSGPRRVSPLARGALLVYLVLVIYASLAPWSGWRNLGVAPWAYLLAPLPRHITNFDVIVNVIAYLPLGALVVWSLYPRWRPAAAILLALAAGTLLSASLEALQTYLPRRIESNVDLAANAAGTLLGALLAALLAGPLIDRGRLLHWRMQWFHRDATLGLVLLALWPAAQIHPGPNLFGNGEMRQGLRAIAGAFGLELPQLGRLELGPGEFMLAEAVIYASAVMAVGLALLAQTYRHAPRLRLLALWLGAGLGAKALAYAVLFGPEFSFVWLTPGAWGGLLVGTLALLAAAAGAPRALARVALLATLVLLVVVNLVPENPYYTSWLQGWRQGRLLNFNALAAWLASAWPLLLLVWLCVRAVLGWAASRGMQH